MMNPPRHPISPEALCSILSVAMDSKKINNEAFRELVRLTLPLVDWDETKPIHVTEGFRGLDLEQKSAGK